MLLRQWPFPPRASALVALALAVATLGLGRGIAEGYAFAKSRGTCDVTQVHLSYTGDPTEMLVSWKTSAGGCDTFVDLLTPSSGAGAAAAASVPSSFVRFSAPLPSSSASSSFSPTASGASSSYSSADMCAAPASSASFVPPHLHEVLLTGLVPGAPFSFRLPREASPRGARAATPPGPSLPLRLLAFGDMGEPEHASAKSPGSGEVLARVEADAADGLADAVLHLGDLAYADGKPVVWETFMDRIEKTAAQVPWMVAIGNHEYDWNTEFGAAGGRSGEKQNALALQQGDEQDREESDDKDGEEEENKDGGNETKPAKKHGKKHGKKKHGRKRDEERAEGTSAASPKRTLLEAEASEGSEADDAPPSSASSAIEKKKKKHSKKKHPLPPSPDASGATRPYDPSWGNYGNDSGGECGVAAAKRFSMPPAGALFGLHAHARDALIDAIKAAREEAAAGGAVAGLAPADASRNASFAVAGLAPADASRNASFAVAGLAPADASRNASFAVAGLAPADASRNASFAALWRSAIGRELEAEGAAPSDVFSDAVLAKLRSLGARGAVAPADAAPGAAVAAASVAPSPSPASASSRALFAAAQAAWRAAAEAGAAEGDLDPAAYASGAASRADEADGSSAASRESLSSRRLLFAREATPATRRALLSAAADLNEPVPAALLDDGEPVPGTPRARCALDNPTLRRKPGSPAGPRPLPICEGFEQEEGALAGGREGANGSTTASSSAPSLPFPFPPSALVALRAVGGSNAPFWYSFSLGPLHVTTVSTEHNLAPGSPQAAWLHADLASVDRCVTPWLAVVQHRPQYVVKPHKSNRIVGKHLRDHLEDVFEAYEVDLVLSGHIHSYARTCNVRAGVCVDDQPVNGGMTHLVVGSGGRKLSSVKKKQFAWVASALRTWGHARLAFDADRLVVEFVQAETGKVLDTVTLVNERASMRTC